MVEPVQAPKTVSTWRPLSTDESRELFDGGIVFTGRRTDMGPLKLDYGSLGQVARPASVATGCSGKGQSKPGTPLYLFGVEESNPGELDPLAPSGFQANRLRSALCLPSYAPHASVWNVPRERCHSHVWNVEQPTYELYVAISKMSRPVPPLWQFGRIEQV